MAYIDKELFKQDIKMRYCNNCARPNEIKCRACHIDDMLGEIEDAPTADVEEVKHGEWIKNQYISQVLGIPVKKEFVFTCSLCGHDTIGKSNYCRECGAKMDGGNAE